MKVLLVADEESSYIWDHFEPERFKGVELVISCGDLKGEYLSYLVTLLNVPVIYVHGNHDQHYDLQPPLGCDCIDGKLAVYNGIRILGLGGSMKYKEASHQYTERDMRRRIKKIKPQLFFNKGFDILVTHSAAYGLGDGDDLCHTGFKCFNQLLDAYEPKYHFHGHQHLNYNRGKRITSYKHTTIINSYGYYIIDIN